MKKAGNFPIINIFVSNDAHISVKNNQLLLQNSFQKVDYPLEDINCVMIESLNTTVSTYTLSKFAEYGICCFVCNQNHLPKDRNIFLRLYFFRLMPPQSHRDFFRIFLYRKAQGNTRNSA